MVNLEPLCTSSNRHDLSVLHLLIGHVPHRSRLDEGLHPRYVSLVIWIVFPLVSVRVTALFRFHGGMDREIPQRDVIVMHVVV